MLNYFYFRYIILYVFRFHEWQAYLKRFYSRKENIPASVFFILCSHYTIVTIEKKNSVIAMRTNSNFKNANLTVFSKSVEKQRFY